MHTLAQLCSPPRLRHHADFGRLVVVGIFFHFSLGVDLFPKVDIPPSCHHRQPGASPEEIETEISRSRGHGQHHQPGGTSALHLSEGSRWSSFSRVVQERRRGAQEVQNKVNLIVPNLPQTAKAAVIQKFDPDAGPPFCRSAASARRSLRTSTLIADSR